jgi:hypothetical protein
MQFLKPLKEWVTADSRQVLNSEMVLNPGSDGSEYLETLELIKHLKGIFFVH